MRSFYFGCWREAGHHLWHQGSEGHPYKDWRANNGLLGVSIHSRNPTKGEIPWGYSLDGGLLKGRSLRQGEAVVEQRDGWTALSFWDRSVDSRPGSSSTFVFDTLLTPEAALAAAREAFPPIFERFSFPVDVADPEDTEHGGDSKTFNASVAQSADADVRGGETNA